MVSINMTEFSWCRQIRQFVMALIKYNRVFHGVLNMTEFVMASINITKFFIVAINMTKLFIMS